MKREPDWLDRLPMARWGWPQLAWFGIPLLIATLLLGAPGPPWCWASIVPAVLLLLVVWFFRDPPRGVPDDPGAYLSPADGTIAEITPLDHYDFIGGPATQIGIFLSIFNVHVNRAARSAQVLETHYQPGEFLNALNPESVQRNEFMWIGFEEANSAESGAVRHAVRQISGAIARRIVCELAPGSAVQAGERFGMIKFGSRTELIVPADVEVTCQVGDKVRGGLTILARR